MRMLFVVCLFGGMISGIAATVEKFDFDSKGQAAWTGLYDAPKIVAGSHGKCLEIATARPVNREYLSPFFKLEPGKKYRVSCLVKVDKFKPGYSPLAINIRWYSAPEETCGFGGWNIFRVMREDKNKTFGWKRVEKIVKVPTWKGMEKKIRYGRIQIRNFRSIGQAKVDNIVVEEAAPTAKAANP